jgi:protein phosphatase 1L
VKWWSKEKGFGKIDPTKGEEQVFVHKNGLDGGPDGLHAQAIDEGIVVTYEIIMREGKPCATSVQVGGIAPAVVYDPSRRDSNQDALVTRLLTSGLQTGTHQITGAHKVSSEDRYLSRIGVSVQLGDFCKSAVTSLFGVFDGHSGASCSDFVAVNLDKTVFDCIRQKNVKDQSGKGVTSDVAIKSALLAAFRTTEHNFFQYANKLEGGAAHAWSCAGSTSCVACFYGPDEECRMKLAIANAGDSRAVLGRRDGSAIRLSQDHTPDVPGEKKRIEQEGSSVVNAHGIWRIVLPSIRGSGIAGLSVSRGFGDLEYKQNSKTVTAVPDIFLRNVDLQEDSFIIIGSDGIWGPVSDEEAVRVASTALREGGADPEKSAAVNIADLAHARDPHDDKTAVVVWFGSVPDAAAVPMSSIPAAAVARMKPSHVASTADDMFTSGPQADLDDLDNLFTAISEEMNM